MPTLRGQAYATSGFVESRQNDSKGYAGERANKVQHKQLSISPGSTKRYFRF